MKDIRQYLEEEEAAGILESLNLLKAEFHRLSSTPVVDEAVNLISNQLDGLSFQFLTDEDFAKQIIQRWEKASFFRKKHYEFTVTDSRAFVAFKIKLDSFVETRTQRVVLSPFNHQITATGFSKNPEPLNARFPLTPFSSKTHRWIQVGSEFRIPCRDCGASGKVDCKKCEGDGWYWQACGECGGTGVVDRINPIIGTELKQNPTLSDHATREQIQCPSCNNKRQFKKKCSRCGGTGKVQCKDCKGTGKQYHRHEVETMASRSVLEKVVTTEKLPEKWLKKIRPSEKIIVQDYLPGTVNQDSIGCDVKIQKMEIAIIPAALVTVQELDGEETKLVISGNEVYPQGNRFGISPLRASVPIILILAVLTGLGYLGYRYNLPSLLESEPIAVVEPVGEPPQVIEEETPEVDKKPPKKKRGKRRGRRKKKADAPVEEGILSPEPGVFIPPPPTPDPLGLDESMKTLLGNPYEDEGEDVVDNKDDGEGG